jgi:putative Mg2+ transporter-C (MgtC) family protein
MTQLIESLPADAALQIELLFRLVLAAVLGGFIGYEREVTRKAAGLRTMILIAVGAALLTGMSLFIAEGSTFSDRTRIASTIATAVGFIGAGVIIQGRGEVRGLTTAGTIWVVAAVGIACGAGAWIVATGATLLVLLVLGPLRRAENRVGRRARGSGATRGGSGARGGGVSASRGGVDDFDRFDDPDERDERDERDDRDACDNSEDPDDTEGGQPGRPRTSR